MGFLKTEFREIPGKKIDMYEYGRNAWPENIENRHVFRQRIEKKKTTKQGEKMHWQWW